MDKLLEITIKNANCPFPGCGQQIEGSLLLYHFFLSHSDRTGTVYQEIFAYCPTSFTLHTKSFKFRENVCLGVLLYGGASETVGTFAEPMSIHNIFLPQDKLHFYSHSPISVMACITSWDAYMDEKAKVTKWEETGEQILVIWLLNLPNIKSVFATLTVSDSGRNRASSVKVKPRYYHDSQNPSEFMPKDANYLRLRNREINQLTEGGKQPLKLTITAQEWTED